MSTTVKEDPKAKAPNDIRIGMNTRVRNVIRYSTWNAPALYIFSMLCANLNSFSVQACRGLIVLSCKMKLQSGRSRSFVSRYVLCEDINT